MTYKNDDIVIVSAQRSAIGTLLGSLSSLKAHEISSQLIQKAFQKDNINPAIIDEVIMGQVLTANTGMNPVRQAAMAANIPQEVPAYTINQVCGSGLRSVALGYQSIKAKETQTVLVGGQESMSNSPHAISMRKGQKLGASEFVDTMISDGLTCAISGGVHMGITAENIAESFNISRAEQDQFSYRSQQKAAEAQKLGAFNDEIIPISIKKKRELIEFNVDEFPRNDTTVETLSKLRPAFKKDGSVTAGNASGINDGSAILVLTTFENATKNNLNPIAKIISWASSGVDPKLMGIGPVTATKKALQKANWSINEVDLFESNEAFAAQSLAVMKELDINPEKVNVNGGAIALGHPIGASGSRILVTLCHQLKRSNLSKGVATLCVGGGMGITVCIERFSN